MKGLKALTYNNEVISAELLADIVSVSKATLLKWEKQGKLIATENPITKRKEYSVSQLTQFEEVRSMIESDWEKESNIKPVKEFSTIELFAGAGGLALGLEMAGLHAIALNECDKDACNTLRTNRPSWKVIQSCIEKVTFSDFDDVDLVSGGFPCQAFSYAGEKLGFEDVRGTLFFEFARVIKETKPKVFLGENVRGLLNHDNGKTLDTIYNILSDLGYTLIAPKVLKALFYKVPQKRERLFLVGIRNDLVEFANFKWPAYYHRIQVLRDALKAGELYEADAPKSEGQHYPERKREILALVPQGGYWKDLPDNLQREYMQGSYFLSGGKTGMARRLSWDEPSLTLTCSPAQKQTERCHPDETRPLTVREYARIQTFPDEWQFSGSISSQYKQIGNAVPVNLAHAVGRSIVELLNSIELKTAPENSVTSQRVVYQKQLALF